MASGPSRAQAVSLAAFTIAELLVALGVIGIVAGSSIYAMLDANRYAAVQRVRTAAKAACQERIDQALTVPYSAPDLLPALFTVGGSIPAPSGSPDRGTETSTESISLYTDQTDANENVVPAKRTTRVSLSDAALGLVRVWVRVEYKFRDNNNDPTKYNYSHEMYAVRAPD
jgi:type II secretory pathway pseudopilin PulG